jgi:hypothetical protein
LSLRCPQPVAHGAVGPHEVGVSSNDAPPARLRAVAGAYTRPLLSSSKPSWSHLPVSPCLIDWGEIMHPTYSTKCARVEPKNWTNVSPCAVAEAREGCTAAAHIHARARAGRGTVRESRRAGRVRRGAGRGSHSFRFQLILSSFVHRITRLSS